MSNKPSASTIIKYSPRKSRLLINSVRGLPLDEAMHNLAMTNKGNTKKITDLIKLASNNLGLTEADYANYKLDTILAEEAQKYYRAMPRARGSASRIRRRFSRIKLWLSPIDQDKALTKAKTKD